MKRYAAYMAVALMLCAMTVITAVAKDKKAFVKFDDNLVVNNTVVKKGEYQVRFDEQTGELTGGRPNGLLGVVHLGLHLRYRLQREGDRVPVGMVSHRMALEHDARRGRSEAPDVFADQEERRPDVLALQDIEHARGIGLVGAVIERQRDDPLIRVAVPIRLAEQVALRSEGSLAEPDQQQHESAETERQAQAKRQFQRRNGSAGRQRQHGYTCRRD